MTTNFKIKMSSKISTAFYMQIRALLWYVEGPLFSSKTVGKNAKQVSEHYCEPSDARATSGSRSPHRCSHFTLKFMSYAFALTLFAFFSTGETALCLDDVIMKTNLEPLLFMGRFHGNLRFHSHPPRRFSWIDFFSGDKSLAFSWQVLSSSL